MYHAFLGLLIFYFHFFCLSKRNETKKKTLLFMTFSLFSNEFMNAKHFRRNFSAKAENCLANSASSRLLGTPEFQSFAQTILAEKGLKPDFISKFYIELN